MYAKSRGFRDVSSPFSHLHADQNEKERDTVKKREKDR